MAERPTVRASRQHQHFIPAAFLGRFSGDRSGRPRTRLLWVRDHRGDRPFISRAGKLARELGIYDVSDGSLGEEQSIDALWSIYEPNLPRALEALNSRSIPINGSLWFETLVPFVAGLFVRSPSFASMFEERIASAPEEVRETSLANNAAGPRVIAFQEMLAPLMVADWTILHFDSDRSLVTSDIGYAGADTPLGQGYAVPVDLHTALFVARGDKRRRVLVWRGHGWVAPIQHVDVPGSEAENLVHAMAAFARHAVYGPTEVSVGVPTEEIGRAPSPAPLGLAPEGGFDAGCHLYDYFRVLSVLASDVVPREGQLREIDWSAVRQRWSGPVAMEVLFPERTAGGAAVEGESVFVDLSFGATIRKLRREAGDFRTGARIVVHPSDVPKETGRFDPDHPRATQIVVQKNSPLAQPQR